MDLEVSEVPTAVLEQAESHDFVQPVTVSQVDLRGKRLTRVVNMRYLYLTRDDQIPDAVAWLRRHRAVGYDVETSGISVYINFLATIQFGNPMGEDPRAYVIDVRCVSREALQPLLDILADPTIVKIGQNIKFECLYTTYRLAGKIRNVIDTQVSEMLARAGLFPGGGDAEGGEQSRKAYGATSMSALARRYLGIEIDKDQQLRTSFYTTPPGTHSRRQIVYAAGDVIYPFFIHEKQWVLLKERQLQHLARLEWELVPILAESELHGILIDTAAWTRLWQAAVVRQDAAQRELDRIFLSIQGDLFNGTQEEVRPVYVGGKGKGARPKPLNWTSSTQIRWAVRQYCEKIHWPIKVITTPSELFKLKCERGKWWLDKKGLTVEDVARDQDDPNTWGKKRPIPDWVLDEREFCILVSADWRVLKLARIRNQLPAELLDPLLAYSEEKALVTTFGVDFLKHLQADGRIHVEFHQLIAATGRMSTEPNSQNIPKLPEYRQCFQPRPGYKFVILDYSQIEPRISAHVSKDAVYVTNYLSDKPDLYVAIGERLFSRKIDKKTKAGDEDRQAAKIIVLALAYLMGPGKLRDNMTIDLLRDIEFSVAAEFRNKYLEECAGIHAFQQRCAAQTDPESPHAQKIWDDMLGAEVTYVTSPCGRHRFFPPFTNAYTQAANHPIQGCSATITKAAAVLVHRVIEREGYDAVGVNYVHDEIVYEVREDQAAAFALVAKTCMEEAGRHYLPDIPVVAEFPEGCPTGVMPYWSKKLQ